MKKIAAKFITVLMAFTMLATINISASAASLKKPTLSSAKANSSSSVTIKWKKVKGASGYVIYRKNGKKAYSKIASVSKSKTSYKNTKLSPSTKYSYKIKAYKKSGKKKVYSKFSNVKSAKTKAGYKLNKASITLTKYAESKQVYITGLSKDKYYDIKWESSDTNIATAYGYGSNTCKITSYQSGTCVVTAKYNGKTYSCKVVVAMPASKCKLVKPAVPAEYSYGYNNSKGFEKQTGVRVSDITHQFKDSYDGTVRLVLSFKCTKTYDINGAMGTNTCRFLVKLKDSNGVIVDKNYCYASNYKVGETFYVESAVTFSKLPADNYSIVLEDYIF